MRICRHDSENADIVHGSDDAYIATWILPKFYVHV